MQPQALGFAQASESLLNTAVNVKCEPMRCASRVDTRGLGAPARRAPSKSSTPRSGNPGYCRRS
ncbi:MAG: hypothetical protein EOO62_26090 [Hymenobacter sp.]|nr:MAG: hypothetical protein EOO62_26090 [Hymenobacter sp.]